jgi:anti-sigma factor RsiW
MNCRQTESLLLAERDGLLTPQQRADLSAHAAHCPACQQLRTQLVTSAELFRTESQQLVVPDVETEWQAVRAQLDTARTTRRAPHSALNKTRNPFAPVLWFGAPLAAAAAIAFAFFSPSLGNATTATAQANYVEAGDANASTMVFLDQESGWLVVWASSEEPAS